MFPRLLMAIVVLPGLALGAAASDDPYLVPELCSVPDILTVSPDGSISFVVNVQGQGGPLSGSYVSVHIGALNDDLLAYCAGQARVGPDLDDGSYRLGAGVSDVNGDVTFFMVGGGCIPTESLGDNWVVEVRADGVVLDNIVINSPDVVNSSGDRPLASGQDNCLPQGGGGVTEVGLSDAVAHTGNIALGLVDLCSKMTAPFGDPVGLADGVILTEYIKAGTFCTCQ